MEKRSLSRQSILFMLFSITGIMLFMNVGEIYLNGRAGNVPFFILLVLVIASVTIIARRSGVDRTIAGLSISNGMIGSLFPIKAVLEHWPISSMLIATIELGLCLLALIIVFLVLPKPSRDSETL